MGPLDRGASVPMRKYVNDESSVATNSLPFQLENECVTNVPERAVHCSDRKCEPTWENDQDFV